MDVDECNNIQAVKLIWSAMIIWLLSLLVFVVEDVDDNEVIMFWMIWVDAK